jgi:hypothetical protein
VHNEGRGYNASAVEASAYGWSTMIDALLGLLCQHMFPRFIEFT